MATFEFLDKPFSISADANLLALTSNSLQDKTSLPQIRASSSGIRSEIFSHKEAKLRFIFIY